MCSAVCARLHQNCSLSLHNLTRQQKVALAIVAAGFALMILGAIFFTQPSISTDAATGVLCAGIALNLLLLVTRTSTPANPIKTLIQASTFNPQLAAVPAQNKMIFASEILPISIWEINTASHAFPSILRASIMWVVQMFLRN